MRQGNASVVSLSSEILLIRLMRADLLFLIIKVPKSRRQTFILLLILMLIIYYLLSLISADGADGRTSSSMLTSSTHWWRVMSRSSPVQL